MQQYMITTAQIDNDKVVLNQEDLHHIYHVMRMKENDFIVCADVETKLKYKVQIIDRNGLLKIVEQLDEDNELTCELVLAFGLVKADKLEFVIQKACELGVSKFIPLKVKNSIIKLDEKKFEKKQVRWEKIIKEACEQSRRNSLMVITRPLTLSELLEQKKDLNIVAYEKAAVDAKIGNVVSKNKSILLVIGPEGGIDSMEYDFLNENDFVGISLGKRILRCETAAISAISIISDLIE